MYIISTRNSATDRSSLSSIVAGFTSTVEYILAVDNPLEDAFQGRLKFVLSTDILELVNVFNQTNIGEVCVCSITLTKK